MESDKRACLAFIIGRTQNSNIHSVYDFGRGRFCLFTSSGDVSNLQVLDHQRNSMLTGSLSGVFDFNTNSYMSINMNGGPFTGFDYGSSTFFSGNISGNVVMIYDGQESSYNTYSMM